MSYILDALKKADAERALGGVPGLHARAMPVLPGDAGKSLTELALRWAGATGLLVAAGSLIWQLQQKQTAGVTEAVSSPVEAASKAASVPPVSGPLAEAVAIGSTPVASAQVPDGGRVGQGMELKLEKNFESLPEMREQRPGPGERRDAARQEPRHDGSDEQIRRRDEGTVIETLSQLPEHIRRELPAFSISGSIYTENPADRLLIVNGRIYHEGDELAPGLILERMFPKAAVLRYKNYRYQLPF